MPDGCRRAAVASLAAPPQYLVERAFALTRAGACPRLPALIVWRRRRHRRIRQRASVRPSVRPSD